MTGDFTASPLAWGGFIAFVLAMLLLDLGVFHRKAHAVTIREAVGWTLFWTSLALVFCAGLWWFVGSNAALLFLSGYIIEQSLSVDNLFVFVLIFQSMRVPPALQHRVLFWGIVSAQVLRAVMIVGGTALLHRFEWLMYVFGAFLVFTGIRFFFEGEEGDEHLEHSRSFKLVTRLIPATHRYDGNKFFTVENGRRVATPLLVTLALIEVSDVVFAVDSIPAIFAVTTNPYLVFTSNIFAILGLRSMYFVLARVMDKFHYLKIGLAIVLCFVGTKMLILPWYKVPVPASLSVIIGVIALSVLASWVRARRLGPQATVEAARLDPTQGGEPAPKS